MDLMLSRLVCGTAPGHIMLFSIYCVSKAILRIDVDKQNQPGSDFDILTTVKTRAEAQVVQ